MGRFVFNGGRDSIEEGIVEGWRVGMVERVIEYEWDLIVCAERSAAVNGSLCLLQEKDNRSSIHPERWVNDVGY